MTDFMMYGQVMRITSNVLFSCHNSPHKLISCQKPITKLCHRMLLNFSVQ